MRMRMKKLLSILLVTAMLASMAVTAFADAPAASNFDGDIMVAETGNGAATVTIAENQNVTFAPVENEANKYVGTVAVTNSDTSNPATVAITGSVTNSDGNSAGTVDVALKTEAPAAEIEVPASSGQLTDTVTLSGTPAAGDYTVKLKVGDNGDEVAVGTINIEDGTKDEANITAALGKFDAQYNAKLTLTNSAPPPK